VIAAGATGKGQIMRLVVPPTVFRPRSDSYQLAAAVADTVRPGDHVLDLCTGSGVVAVAAARAGAGAVLAVDSSTLSSWTACVNGALNGVLVRPRRGDLFDSVGDQRFDLIASNPPYLPGPWPDQPPALTRAIDGGPDGRDLLDRIIDGAPTHLRPGGTLLLIHSIVCDVQSTWDRIRASGLRPALRARHRGRLGPLLASKRDALVGAGRLPQNGDEEDVVIVSGQLPA
jgi:release factor glutamine methyltransferase